jgi:16S rRNA C967 or C1407 C5-methylase (RsmB/RsmF family)
MKFSRNKQPAPPVELTLRQIQLAQALYLYFFNEQPQSDPWQLFEATLHEVEITDSKTVAGLWHHIWKLQNDRFRYGLILANPEEFPVQFAAAFYWWLYVRFSWGKIFNETSGLYEKLRKKPADWQEIKAFFRKLETAYSNHLMFLEKQELLARESWQKSSQPWLIEHARKVFTRGEREAIFLPDFSDALSLRTNALKTDRTALLNILEKDGLEAIASRRSANGILSPIAPVLNLPGYQTGLFEIQDEISQLLLELCPVQPGWQVWNVFGDDGAHSLALAALMKNQGEIFVTNAHGIISKNISERAARAGIDILAQPTEPVPKCDLVWLAAPNSQTGILRANPAIKARLTENDFNERLSQQQRLLELAATGVKPGGWLGYTTQSVFSRENDQQIEDFLQKHPEFEPVRISSSLLENYPKKCWTAFGFTTFPLIRKVTAQYLSLLKLKE